jgi:hypothetical protein
MEEVIKTNSAGLPPSPEVIGDLVNTKESLPTPPQKVKIVPLIILGLAISGSLVGIGFLIRHFILSRQQPDIVIDTSASLYPSISITITPTGETTTLVPQKILFENKPYQNTTAGFEIKVPSGWQIDDSGKSGAVVVLIDPKVTMASNSALLTFINVTTGIPTGPNLSDQVAAAKIGLQKQFSNYTINEDQDLTVSGNTYHLLSGTYLSHGTLMRNRNLILIHNNRGYAISATAPDSVWPQNELLLNASLFSFENI